MVARAATRYGRVGFQDVGETYHDGYDLSVRYGGGYHHFHRLLTLGCVPLGTRLEFTTRTVFAEPDGAKTRSSGSLQQPEDRHSRHYRSNVFVFNVLDQQACFGSSGVWHPTVRNRRGHDEPQQAIDSTAPNFVQFFLATFPCVGI